MVLINLHRNLHEKSSFLSEIMFIRINPYLCHLLTRYQSTIFPNHKSCVRKKGVPSRVRSFFAEYPDPQGRTASAAAFRRTADGPAKGGTFPTSFCRHGSGSSSPTAANASAALRRGRQTAPPAAAPFPQTAVHEKPRRFPHGNLLGFTIVYCGSTERRQSDSRRRI